MDKLLLVANPRAGSVSARTREVIVKALSADFKLEVAQTTARDHATELASDAVDRDFDAVVAFGGDGTINEVAQRLIRTDVALGIIPGGSTNVMARSLGIPRDPVEATAFLASRLRTRTTRRVNVGSASGRHFLFSCGMGLDAEVVRQVEADPVGKRERGEWLFLSHALKTAMKRYRGRDPWITIEGESDARKVLLAICCKSRPFTYFKRFPVDVCPEARLDGGLDLYGLAKIRTLTVPRVVWGVFVARSHVAWRSSFYKHDLEEATFVADEPLPVQVDGDYIGEHTRIDLTLIRDGLDLLV